MAARYRKRGLDKTARRMVDLLDERGVQGSTVLEIGGGVGEIQLELLRRGAASATNLELSPGYETEAAALMESAGFTGRVQRRLVDIADDPSAVEPADIVILHRVVCCYPDSRSVGHGHRLRVLLESYEGRTDHRALLGHCRERERARSRFGAIVRLCRLLEPLREVLDCGVEH
jgi:hypothetical protein